MFYDSRMMTTVEAWQKLANAPTRDFDPLNLQSLKYSNSSGLLQELDRLWSTMFHEWPTLQKDAADVMDAVMALDWVVAPRVDDGKQPSSKAQEVADVVNQALWMSPAQEPGTFGHSFLELTGALVEALYRGVNVHEICWKRTSRLVYPAEYRALPAQYYMWETREKRDDRLLLVPDGRDYANPIPFRQHKFIVGMNTLGADHPMYNAVYYSLVGYFLAAKMGLPALQDFCHRYGHPVRKFVFERESDRNRMMDLLEDYPDLYDVFLKPGDSLEVTPIPAAANVPHEVMLKLAENMCHQVILGQTLTSDTSAGGSLAQAKVHMGVLASVVCKRAEFVCRILNRQLVPAIVYANYGTCEGLPIPELKCSLPDEDLTLDRVQVVRELLSLPGFRVDKSFVYEFLRIPIPARDDDVFEGSSGRALLGSFHSLRMPVDPPEEEKPEERVRASRVDSIADRKERDDQEEREELKTYYKPLLDQLEKMLDEGADMEEVASRLRDLRPDTAALSDVFERNLRQSFGMWSGSRTVERVSAENPYGCNQYGEGWSEPHNGNSTGYRNMSPFNTALPASKVLKSERDGNTVEQVTHAKHVGKEAYPDASEVGLEKEAQKERSKAAEKKAGEESGRKEAEENEEERKRKAAQSEHEEEEGTRKEFKPAATIAEAEEFARKQGVKFVSFKGCDLETANAFNHSLVEHLGNFPRLKESIGFYGSIQEKKKFFGKMVEDRLRDKYKNCLPWSTDEEAEKWAKKEAGKYFRAKERVNAHSFDHRQSFSDDSFVGIAVNKKYGKDSTLFTRMIQRDVTAGFHPPHTGSIKAVADHEFGHKLDDLLKIRDHADFRKAVVRGANGVRLSANSLSGYALTYNWETIAEAWSEYRNSPQPREWATFIGKLIESEYKRKYGSK